MLAEEVLALGVLSKFIQFLQCHDDPILQVTNPNSDPSFES